MRSSMDRTDELLRDIYRAVSKPERSRTSATITLPLETDKPEVMALHLTRAILACNWPKEIVFQKISCCLEAEGMNPVLQARLAVEEISE
jgi:hypothetical protein